MSHRFGYVISNYNFDDLEPQRIMIVPYLHDKRIYLHRQKPNNKYFYTSIETHVDEGMKNIGKSKDIAKSDDSLTAIVCLNQTANMYHIYSQKGVLVNQFAYGHLIEEYGTPVATSSNGQSLVMKKSILQLQQQECGVKDFMIV